MLLICLNKHNNKHDVFHEKVIFNLTISPSRVSTYCGASPHLWVIMHLRSIYWNMRNIFEVLRTYEVFTEVGVMPSKYITLKIWGLPLKSLITARCRTLIILLCSTIPGMSLSIDIDASNRIFWFNEVQADRTLAFISGKRFSLLILISMFNIIDMGVLIYSQCTSYSLHVWWWQRETCLQDCRRRETGTIVNSTFHHGERTSVR